jgi:hypothetical protein
VTDIGEYLIAQEGGRVAGLTVFLVLGEVAGAARSFLQAHHTAHPAASAPVVRVAARVVLPAPSPPHGAIEEGELGVTLEGEDVGGDAVEEPAVVGGHHDAAGDCRQRADASGTPPGMRTVKDGEMVIPLLNYSGIKRSGRRLHGV